MHPSFKVDTNRLIAGARSGRPPSYLRPALYLLCEQTLTLGFSVVVGLVIGVTVILPMAASGQLPDPGELYQQLMEMLTRGWPGLALSLPQFLLLIGWTWLWVRLVERRPFHTIGLRTRRPLLEWGRGMAGGLALFVLGVALVGLTGNLRWNGVAPAGMGPAMLWTVVTLGFYLIQGPAEEVMARGYLLPALSARGGLWVGIVVSSLVFAAEHALNPNVTPLALFNLLLYGIFAALYALREEGLWGIFGFHTAWNWVQGSVLGMEVSGANLSPAPLFSLSAGGPAWWGGGAFGPEGGLAVTLTTLLGIAAMLFWPARKEDPEDVSV